jgi:hypothetical protein
MTRYNSKSFADKATIIHNNKYDYSLVDYIGYKKHVTIICSIHGEFVQQPVNHLYHKTGCPKCNTNRDTLSIFKQKAIKIHGNKYDYTKVDYVDTHTKVTITCNIHGDFQQKPSGHIGGKHGCLRCARSLTTEQFVKNALIVHTNLYNYDVVEYVHNKQPVNIICPIHGTFKQKPDSHVAHQHGCPACGVQKQRDYSTPSKGEQQIAEFIRELGVDICQQTRKIIAPLELDIFIPGHNVAIEYCGLYWHNDRFKKDRNYHKIKYDMCADNGIQLLTIFEDEWATRDQQIRGKIKSLLGIREQIIYARKCKVVNITKKDKAQFFNYNHIQGDGPSSINFGLVYNNELVAGVGFINKANGNFCLNRYATKHHVVGGFSKLLKHFTKTTKWNTITSFADLRWSVGNLYTRTGWTLNKIIPPDYSYIKNNKRIHKFNFRRKHLPRLLKHFDPSKTEKQNCYDNNILRIWDCGKMRFIVDNNQV